jgi:hypothetical protein
MFLGTSLKRAVCAVSQLDSERPSVTWLVVATMILCSVFSVSMQAQTVTLRLDNPTRDSFVGEVGWNIVNAATNLSVHCHATGGTPPTTATFEATPGDYIVYGWDSFGDNWQGTTITITRVSDGLVLVNRVQKADRLRATSTCPGLSANGEILARFTVASPCAGPTITQQPTSRFACTGTTTTFTVASTMTNGTYEWRKDGVVQATTTVPSWSFVVAANSAGVYDVVLRNACNPATAITGSSPAVLTVAVAPTITQQPPATRDVCEGSNDTLRIRAVATGRVLQWRRNGVNLAGATDSVYIIANAGAAHVGTYDCVVSGQCAPTITSSSTAFNVVFRPRTTAEPQDLILCPSASSSMTFTASGTNLTYQWFRNGQAIPGATSPTFAINNYQYSMNGLYRCVATSNVSNPNNCQVTATSREVNLAGYVQPILVSSPTTTDACVGSRLTLTSEFTGSDLNYQWFRDTVAIPNINSNVLTIDRVTAAHAGRYTVRATGTCGLNVTSTAAVVTVIAQPTITKNLRAMTVEVGKPINLSVEATDVRTVQWFKNGQPIAGATSVDYTIAVSKYSDAGSYYAIIRNGCGAVNTTAALVKVVDEVIPVAELELGAASSNMGEIPVGHSRTTVLASVITNSGTAPLTVLSVTSSNPAFVVTSAPANLYTLQPGQSASITIVGTATTRGTMAGAITVTTNAPANSTGTITLAAEAVLRYDIAQLADFGTVAITTTKTLCVDVTNTSSTDVAIDNASIAGANSNQFAVQSTLPVTVGAGQTVQLCLDFTPTTAGAKAAALNIVSSTGGNSTVNMSGLGDDPSSVVEASSLGITVAPNPSFDAVSISLGSLAGNVAIRVMTATGRTVTSFDVADATAGTLVRWDGRDLAGTPVSSGMYYILVQSGSTIATVPVTIVR